MHSMKKILLILFLITCVRIQNNLYAQGQIQVFSTVALDSLVEFHKEANKLNPTINGYRVQVFFGSDRKSANDARTAFLQLYPDVEAYIIYQQPNFKVRVGDFRTHQEAQEIFRNLLPHFGKIFIVPDKINLPKL